jgi:hypothetical protein
MLSRRVYTQVKTVWSPIYPAWLKEISENSVPESSWNNLILVFVNDGLYTYPSIFEFSLQRTTQTYIYFSIYDFTSTTTLNQLPMAKRALGMKRTPGNKAAGHTAHGKCVEADSLPRLPINLLISYHCYFKNIIL